MSEKPRPMKEQERKAAKELYSLLMSFEDEAEEHERRGPPPYIQREKAGDREIVIYGTEHVFLLKQVKEMATLFESTHPDLLLVEGTTWEYLNEPALTDEEALAKYGEQAYMVRLAKHKGIEVRSWDSPHKEQLAAAITEHSPESTLAWIIFMAAKHLLNQKKTITETGLREMASLFLDKKTLDELKHRSLPLDPAKYNFENIVKKFGGKHLTEINPEIAEFYATPWHRGITNDVNRTMVIQRDRHAIDTFAEAKKTHKKIFVTAGGDHVLTWEKAVKKLFGS